MRGKTSIPARCVESNWKERELISVEMVNLSPLEGITRLTGRQVTWKLDYTRIELCLIAHTRPPRTLEWSRRNPEGIQVSRSVLWITRLYITWVTCNIVVNVTRIYNNRVTFEVTRLLKNRVTCYCLWTNPGAIQEESKCPEVCCEYLNCILIELHAI